MPNPVVVVPLYRDGFSHDEKISLQQLSKHLFRYPIVFLSSKMRSIPVSLKRADFKIIDASHFESVRSYSTLLLTNSFYEAFNTHSHMLIYQLDSIVFADRLNEWASQPYDYLGAPNNHSLVGRLTSSTTSSCLNGGFSLRNIQTFIKVLSKNQNGVKIVSPVPFSIAAYAKAFLRGKSPYWWGGELHNYPFNEDGFWSFEAKKILHTFRLPSDQIAKNFAREQDTAGNLNADLPFGCHAWTRYDRKYWENILNRSTKTA